MCIFTSWEETGRRNVSEDKPLTGYRIFMVAGGGGLYSPYQYTLWRNGKLSVPKSKRMVGATDNLRIRETTGIHVFKNLTAAENYMLEFMHPYHRHVICRVTLWGKVFRYKSDYGTIGYLAEHVRVEGVARGGYRYLNGVRRRYLESALAAWKKERAT